jgi:hypothetical protein
MAESQVLAAEEEVVEIVPVTQAERILMSRQVRTLAQQVRFMRTNLPVECRKNRRDTRALLRAPFAKVLASARSLPKDHEVRREVEATVASTIDMAEIRHYNFLQNEMEQRFVVILADLYDVVMRRVQIMEEFDLAQNDEHQIDRISWYHQLTSSPQLIDYYRMDVKWDGAVVSEAHR